MYKDITAAKVEAEIADLTKRLAAMLKVEADHYKHIDSMRASIAADREIIAKLKAAGAPEALGEVREKVAAALETLRKAESGPAPGGATSTKYRSIEAHIINLRAQLQTDADVRKGGYYVAPGIDTGQEAARAIRQAAEGKRAEAEEATAVRLWEAEVAARNRELDGV